MTNELLLRIKNHTDTPTEQTKLKSQVILVFKLNIQIENFAISPPMNFFEGRKGLLSVTSFGATNPVFNLTDKNNSFSLSTSSYWTPNVAEKTFDQINEILGLRSQNDIEIFVNEVAKDAREQK